MKVYAYQMDIIWEDKEANFLKVLHWSKQIQPTPDSLIVLPEMFATGFSMNTDMTQESANGPTESFLKRLALEYSCYILAGLNFSREKGRPSNDALLLNPEGQRLGHYSKIHPFSIGQEDKHYAAGKEIQCFHLPGGLRLCPFICYDLRFPEVFRRALQGTEAPHIFVVIANWPDTRTTHWIRLLEARAIENQAYVIGVNRCGSAPLLNYDGSSMIIDPHGKTLATAETKEGVCHAEVDPEEVNEWRKRFPGLQDRRDMNGIHLT
jgi:omega-amidase